MRVDSVRMDAALRLTRLLFFNMFYEFRQAAERFLGKGFRILCQIRSLAHDLRDKPFQQPLAAGIVGKSVTGAFNSLL